jgi:hypothetical protein
MTKYVLPLAAALLLLPTAATAAPAQTGLTDEGGKVQDNGSVREIIFDKDDNIDGEVLSPGGVNVGGRVAKIHKSMIGIRGEFIPQLIQLSNDI